MRTPCWNQDSEKLEVETQGFGLNFLDPGAPGGGIEGRAGPQFPAQGQEAVQGRTPERAGQVRRGPGAFADVVAFVVGGGSYLEREAVSRWASRSSSSSSSSSSGKRRVVYGATELLSGEEFAAQLGELARRSGLA